MIDVNIYKIKAQKYLKELKGRCISIYLGGSLTQEYLKKSHDIDFIFFVNNIKDATYVKAVLDILQKTKPYLFKRKFCIKQIEIVNDINDYYKIEYWSYMYKDMVLLAGEPIGFTFEPLGKDREEFIKYLKNTIDKVNNPKHYYHYLRSAILLKKNSYDLTEEEIEKLNLLHKCEADEELINYVKEEINSL